MSEYTFQMPNAPEEYKINLADISIDQINYSALDYRTIQKLIIEYISLYHKDQFNDFVEHNAIQMLSELIAYIGHLLSNRQDLQANENFLPTAKTTFAVDQHLKVLNNKLRRPTPATVEVSVEIDNALTTVVQIPAATSFNVYSADGEEITYEIFRAPNNWEDPIEIIPGATSTKAYGVEGTFKTLSYIAEGIENEQFIIYDNNIIEDQFIIDVTIDNITQRWIKVDSIESYDADDMVYELIYITNGVIVKFGNNFHGLKLSNGAEVNIKYRSGGGIIGRIDPKAIDEYKSISLGSNMGVVDVHFINYNSSNGGTDIETIEHAKKRVSAESFTLSSVVTSKDYIDVCENFSHSIYGTVAKASVAINTGVEDNLDVLIDQIRAIGSDGEFIKTDDECKQLLLNNYVNKNIVNVYILAYGTTNLSKPSEWLKEGLKNYLESIGPITDQININDGNFKNIDLDIDVIIDYNSDITSIKSDVENTIDDFFSYNNFNMGEGFYLSKFINEIQSINGINNVKIKSPNYDIIPVKSITTTKSDEIGISEIINLQSRIVKYYRKKNV